MSDESRAPAWRSLAPRRERMRRWRWGSYQWTSSTQVTDAGIKEIANIKGLSSLRLDSTQVTDTGLKEIAKHKKLTSLNLTGTKVTDVGLTDLANLRQLS